MTNGKAVDPDHIRDIPVGDVDSPLVHSVPREVAELIAKHLTALGYRQTVAPQRKWVPPKDGPIHSMNPGSWEEVIPDDLTGQV